MKTFKIIADQLNCTLVPIKYHNFGHTSKGYDIVNANGYILFSFIPYNDGKANIWKVIQKINNVGPNIIYGTAREVVARKDFYQFRDTTNYKLSGFSGSLVNAQPIK